MTKYEALRAAIEAHKAYEAALHKVQEVCGVQSDAALDYIQEAVGHISHVETCADCMAEYGEFTEAAMGEFNSAIQTLQLMEAHTPTNRAH